MFDCEEALRWIKHSKYTLESAKTDLENNFYSWACFKSHQVAEYALKSILRGAGLESYGHDLLDLWRKAKEICNALEEQYQCIILLNKMYIPTRYPDAWPGRALPFENYTEKDSREAISCAEKIYRLAEACISEACKNTT